MGSFIRDDDGFIVVYVDGSCPSNGRYNAKAGIGVWFRNANPFASDRKSHEYQCRNTSSHSSGKSSIESQHSISEDLHRLGICDQLCNQVDLQVDIRNDNWKTENGERVKNRASLIDMYYAIKRLEKVKFKHVRGHRGNYGNERADRLARDGAERY